MKATLVRGVFLIYDFLELLVKLLWPFRRDSNFNTDVNSNNSPNRYNACHVTCILRYQSLITGGRGYKTGVGGGGGGK